MIKDTKPAKQSATKDITKATFECSPSYTYTGKAITPVEVSYGGKKLTEDKDYEINYVKNTAVGTATVRKDLCLPTKQ